MKLVISLLNFILLFIYVNGQVIITSSPSAGPVTAIPEPVRMNDDDRNCAYTLLSALGITTYQPTVDLCSVYPANFICDSNGYLKSFNITGVNQGFIDSGYNINYNSLKCFLNSPFPTGNFSKIKVQIGFWQTNITLSGIVLDDCVIEDMSTIVYFTGSLEIYPKGTNSFNTLNMFLFKNLKSFTFINHYKIGSYSYQLANTQNVFVQNSTPDFFKIEVSSIPLSSSASFANLKVKRLELISNNFATSDGGSYIQTMTGIEELSLSISTSESILPIGLFTTSGATVFSFKKLEINFAITSSDTQLINLNNLPTVETLVMSNIPTFLTPTSTYKIISFGNVKTLVFNSVVNSDSNSFLQVLGNVESLTITSSSFNLDISNAISQSNLKKLYLDSNSLIVGNLPSKVCQLTSVVIKNSNIGGELPSCIYCYLNSTNEDFRGNSFTNYNQYLSYQVPECTSILPRFTRSSNLLYLQGSDLGFTTDAFYTSPPLNFILETPSTSFYTSQAVSGMVNVYFKIPNKNFTLDTSSSPPVVDSVVVSPLGLNGVLTINGNYFSYDVNAVTVMVGSENCNIISSTFSQIKCQVNNYNPNLLNVQSQITVETSFITIPISMTPGLTNLYKTCSQSCDSHQQCSRFTGACIPLLKIDAVSQTIITPSNVEIILTGFFGSTQGDAAVYIDGVSCSIKSFSISSIACNIQFGSESQIQIYITQNGYQSNSFPFRFSISYCPNNCTDSSHGSCNYNNGVCSCTGQYGGDSCLYQYPNVLSVLASNENGGEFIIKGVFGSIGSDFKVLIDSQETVLSVINDTTIIGTAQAGNGTHILTVINNGLVYINQTGYVYTFDCINIGGCNNGRCIHMNKCLCDTDYYGHTCLIKIHYVSALIPTTINGGTVVAFGEFGNTHDFPQVLVGSENCTNLSINTTTIECSIGPGTGLKSFTVKQNDLMWTRSNYFSYINPVKSCPSNCTSKDNGECDTTTGECKCIENKFSGFDCSLPIFNNNNNGGDNSEPVPVSKSTIDTETGVAQIQNQNTKFNISIIKILELSITDQSIVSEIPLKQVWDSYQNTVTSDGNNLYIFNQTLSTENSNIIYKIEEVKKSKTYNFADLKYTVPDDSIKITIEINNFPFSSVLNILQLQMVSSTESETHDTSCNQKESNSEIQDGSDSNSFIKISIDKKILYGRFITKILSNNRPTFISSDLVSKTSNEIIMGLNLPHCDISCVIDPDFSLLIESDFKNSCDESSNKTKIIAIAVVVPVVVVTALVVAGAIIYRKNRIKIRVKAMKLRTFK